MYYFTLNTRKLLELRIILNSSHIDPADRIKCFRRLVLHAYSATDLTYSVITNIVWPIFLFNMKKLIGMSLTAESL